MKKSIGLNAVVSGLRTIMAVIFPLITYPYITRVLGVESLGRYNFAFSIMSYLFLLASLGITTYSVRTGSKYRNDPDKVSEFVSEVFTISLFSSALAYAVMFALVFFVPGLNPYCLIMYILSIRIIITTLGCEWVYQMFEEYTKIAFRSILFNILALVMMFLLVKNQDDVLWYAAVIVVSSSGANIINFLGLKKYCRIRLIFSKSLLKHMAPILILFANTLATTIYVGSDITILGILATDYEVGIYSIASKIYAITKDILAAVIIVSIPRLSFLWGKSRFNEYNNLASKILNTLMILIIPASVGLFCLRKEVILILATKNFLQATIPLAVLCIALVFAVFSWFYTSCVLIPIGKENIVLKITIISAIMNVVLNFIMIPLWMETAAAITTALSEFCSMALCFYYSRKEVSVIIIKKDVISVIIGSLFVFGFCGLVHNYFSNMFIVLIVCVGGSVVGYVIILYIFKNKTFLDMTERSIKIIRK